MSELRLDHLIIENFRSISGSWHIPLDAQIVLVNGPNGSGKTSLLSAIELAATGDVGFLADQAGQLHETLLNRNHKTGRVRLRLRLPDGSTRSGDMKLETTGINGSPALSAQEQVLFRERSYLPQTALGRLLETYTATGTQVDTALVRFVKAVVGLDDLDSLIDGLEPAAHIARTRKSSKHWEASNAALADAIEARRSVTERIRQTEKARAEAVNLVRRLLGDEAADLSDEEVIRRASVVREATNTEVDEAAQLEALRVRLEGISTAYFTEIGADVSHPNPVKQAESANRARTDYLDWESGDGALVLAQLNEIRARLFGLSSVDMNRIFEAFEECKARLDQESLRRAETKERDLEIEHRRSQLTRDIESLNQEIHGLEESIEQATVASDVRVLVEILERIIPIINSEVCPICDQVFVAGTGRLRDHVGKKVASLSQAAQDLMKSHANLEDLRKVHSTRSKDLESLPAAREEPLPIDSDVRVINSLASTIAVGAKLLDKMERTSAQRAEASSHIAARDVATRNLTALRVELGLDSDNLEVSDELAYLREAIEKRSQVASSSRTRRIRIAEATAAIEDRSQELSTLARELSELKNVVSVLEDEIKTATDRKAAANDLRLAAQRIRSSVINHVFDQTLNTLWADLFNRFVPHEPFVPRFKKQTAAKRSVDIRLETELPNGEVSGTPSSMLSYGNTNTAALSLFMALHLSAPTTLPWLIFDDPVQSMDDIHIANLAAVVRQVSYAHGRQVVIAVHQQELFDYLALELAPATPQESLLKVTVRRNGNASDVHYSRLAYESEPALMKQGHLL